MQIEQYLDESSKLHGIKIDGQVIRHFKTGAPASHSYEVHFAKHEGKTYMSIPPTFGEAAPLGAGVYEISKIA